MKTATMDFKGTREKLRGQLERAETGLVDVRDRLGELALDVQLGNAPQAELEKARGEQTALTSRIAELQAALEKVDEREADHKAVEAETQRKADAARLAELVGACNAAGAELVDMAAKVADILGEGREAVREADALGRKLDVSTVVIARWPVTAQQILMCRSGMHGGFMRPGELEAAELSLAGRQ